MAFKSASGKVLTLLKACLPDNAFIQKRLLIEEILELQSYRELKVYEPALDLFTQYYGKASLCELSFEKLQGIKEAIPFANELLPALVGLKNHGNVAILKPEDRPDFYSKDSLECLMQKISGQVIGKNVTNLSDSEIMLLFDPETVVDPVPYVGQIDEMYSNAVSDGLIIVLADRKYCIPQNLVDDCQNDLSDKITRCNQELKRLNRINAISRLHRIMLSFIVVLVVTILLKILGTAIYGYSVSFAAFFLVAVVFIIWG